MFKAKKDTPDNNSYDMYGFVHFMLPDFSLRPNFGREKKLESRMCLNLNIEPGELCEIASSD